MAALKIAFLAWDAKTADTYLRQLAIDNTDQVKRYERNQGRVLLKDGTEIKSFHHGNPLTGYRFDQVIIADDRRLKILRYCGAELNELEHSCQGSIVPEEYRYQFYDLDEEAPKDGI